jgi:hypothetical protein
MRDASIQTGSTDLLVGHAGGARQLMGWVRLDCPRILLLNPAAPCLLAETGDGRLARRERR